MDQLKMEKLLTEPQKLKGNRFPKEETSDSKKVKQLLHKEREVSTEKSKKQDMASGGSVHDFEDEKMQKFFMTFLQAVGNFQVQLEEEKQTFLSSNMEKIKKMEERIKELEYENESLRKANHNLTEQLDTLSEEKKDSTVDESNGLLTMKKELEEITTTMQSLQADQAKERMKYYSLKEQLEAARQTIAQQKGEIEKLRSNSTDNETPPSIDYTTYLNRKPSESNSSGSVGKTETPKPANQINIPRSKTPSLMQPKITSNIPRTKSAKSLAAYGKQASLESIPQLQSSMEEEATTRKRRNSLLQKVESLLAY